MLFRPLMENLARTDPEVAEAVRKETERQGRQLEMIASENFVSEAVLEAMGSVLTNKYAEGYPGRRYYGGCDWVDVAERLAIERAKRLFGCAFANVLALGGRSLDHGLAERILEVWLRTPFAGGRHARRVAKIEPGASGTE